MLFVQFKGQRLLEGLGVGGFVGAVRASPSYRGVGVVFLELGTAIFDDALAIFHGQRIGAPLSNNGHRPPSSLGEVALGGVHIVDGQALLPWPSHRLGRRPKPTAISRPHRASAGQSRRSQCGPLRWHRCRRGEPSVPSSPYSETSACISSHAVEEEHRTPPETGIDRIGQILQAGGHGRLFSFRTSVLTIMAPSWEVMGAV